MKVLGFVRDSAWDKLDAVQFYRTYLPLREVNRRDNGISAMCAGGKQLDGVTDDELGGRDIYTMCRMYNDDYQVFIDEVHRRGGIVVFDSDDDLTETYKLVSGRGEEFKRVLGAVDYVTCSTPPLAKVFQEYTKEKPVVLRNCVDSEWMQKVAGNGKRLVEGLTLGFSGSPTHWGDWYIPAVPFAQIGAAYPDVTLILHGEAPRYLGFAAEKASVLKLDGVPFSIYPVLLGQFDMVICAVDSRDQFNDGKSGLKALECMALGVIPICSRFQPYLDLEAAGAPIVIIEEESRDAWYEAMKNLIEDEDRRLELSLQGPAWVLANRDMVHNGYKAWQDFYHSISAEEEKVNEGGIYTSLRDVIDTLQAIYEREGNLDMHGYDDKSASDYLGITIRVETQAAYQHIVIT